VTRFLRLVALVVLPVAATLVWHLGLPVIVEATITTAHVTKGTDSADATSYTTASVSPTANRLQLLAVGNTKATLADTPTVTGCSLTWVQVPNGTGTYGTDGIRRLTVFRALSATPGSACTLTIDFGANTQTGGSWHWNEFVVQDTSSNGANAIVQSVLGSEANASSGSVTLGALGAADNASFGCFGIRANTTWTAGTNFTELSTEAAHGTPIHTIGCEWRQTHGGFTTVDASFGATAENRGIALEIKDTAAGTPLCGGKPVYAFAGVTYCFPAAQGAAGTALMNDGAGTLSWTAADPPDIVTYATTGGCPSGWSEYTAGRGRYVVGLPLSGTNAATVGTALTNLENRPVGQHSHAITDPGHNHTQNAHGHGVSDPGHAHTVPNLVNENVLLGSVGGVAATRPSGTSAVGTAAPGLTAANATATNQAISPGVTIDNAGSVLGTNAPYLQLVICRSVGS
jgi:hypothetical protein